ncbi:alpha/beta fold hydrolase [Actinosynnema sp. CA-248983]
MSAARDFDAVRAALGARQVSWPGLSYGTLLGATHARLFPHRVRAAAFAAQSTDPAYRVIACHDFPSDVEDFSDIAVRRREVRRIAPVTRGYVEGRPGRSRERSC